MSSTYHALFSNSDVYRVMLLAVYGKCVLSTYYVLIIILSTMKKCIQYIVHSMLYESYVKFVLCEELLIALQ